MEPGELQYSLDKVLKKLDALQESVAVLQKLATSNSARLVLTPSRRPSRWTVNNALLSLVASFLSLKDLVCLLSVLSQIPGQDITFVPGDALVDAMVRRAVPRGVSIKAAALHWVDLCNPSSRHSKFLGIDQLRMLHFFLASIPTDLRVLDNDGRHHPLKDIGSQYRAWGSLCQKPALRAGSSGSALNLCTMSCRLSAQIKGSTRIELTAQCKQCATLACPFVVLRSCPVCSEICSGCDSRKHAPVCRVCLSAVCSSCMLTGNNSMTAGGKICKNDGFTCFSCFKVLANGHRYKCAKGDGCPMTHSVCVDCVFDQQILETLSCQGCAKHWCAGCAVFPTCGACPSALCDGCSDMTKCERCSATYHGEDCCWENGNTCTSCDVYLCNACEQMFSCETCGDSICLKCKDSKTSMSCSDEEHRVCLGCRDTAEDRCVQIENTWGCSVSSSAIDKSCFDCWHNAYAKTKGFFDTSQFNTAMHGGNSYSFNAALPAALKGIVQCWYLGGSRHPDTAVFNNGQEMLANLDLISGVVVLDDGSSGLRIVVHTTAAQAVQFPEMAGVYRKVQTRHSSTVHQDHWARDPEAEQVMHAQKWEILCDFNAKQWKIAKVSLIGSAEHTTVFTAKWSEDQDQPAHPPQHGWMRNGSPLGMAQGGNITVTVKLVPVVAATPAQRQNELQDWGANMRSLYSDTATATAAAMSTKAKSFHQSAPLSGVPNAHAVATASVSASERLDDLWRALPSLNMSEIEVYSNGQFINGLRCSLLLPAASSSLMVSQPAVGHHGNPTSSKLLLSVGERVVSVHLKYGTLIDSIRFVTTTGCRRRSKTFGGPGGDNSVSYTVPAGWKLAGFFGGVGGHLHNLGVIVVKEAEEERRYLCSSGESEMQCEK